MINGMKLGKGGKEKKRRKREKEHGRKEEK
jgi:hypothetical protein